MSASPTLDGGQENAPKTFGRKLKHECRNSLGEDEARTIRSEWTGMRTENECEESAVTEAVKDVRNEEYRYVIAEMRPL